MTDTNPQQAAFTVTAQTIQVTVSGQPDVENRFGPGKIRPDGVRLSYRGHHIDARVDGQWVRESGEVTDSRLDQCYAVRDATDIVQWPDWLCALATLLRPAAASAPVSPAPADWIDGHPQLEAIAAAVWERCGRSDSGGCVEDDPRNIAVAALAAVLPASADRAALRDRIAEALRPGSRDRSGQYPEGLLRDVDAVLAVLPEPTNQAALSDTDRQFLTFALELAADEMASRGDEFGDDDEAALETLRRLAASGPGGVAGEAQAETQAPDIVAAIVTALQHRAGELSELAEEQMRPSLEERAQEWHDAADVARRTARKLQPAAVSQPDGEA
jgi:hypothetical protein